MIGAVVALVIAGAVAHPRDSVSGELELRADILAQVDAARAMPWGDRNARLERYRSVLPACADYLARFPEHPRAAVVRVACTDVLYRTEDFAGALEAYRALEERERGAELGRRAARGAAWSAVELLKRSSDDRRGIAAVSRDRAEVLPTREERDLVQALSLFLEHYPDDPESPTFLLQRGYFWHNRHDHEVAEPDFLALVERFPDAGQAQQAALLLVDGLVEHRDWAAVEARVHDLLHHAVFVPRGATRADLEEVARRAQAEAP